MTNLSKIVDLARKNTDENWEKINSLLPQYTDQQEFFSWAGENLKNSDSGLRDLAASIFEQTKLPLDDAIVKGLFKLMEETDEENPYPSFRAACALAKKHEDERVSGKINQVRRELQSFVEDEDVSEIAKGYLKKVEQSKHKISNSQAK